MAPARLLRQVAAFLLALAAVIIYPRNGGKADAQTIASVRSTYHEYDPPDHNYDLAGLYCATWDASQSYGWRSQYFWTAYCADDGPAMGRDLCGRCIQVTNQDTGESVTARILDQCANGGLDLETDAFNAIDSDGAGNFNGHLIVDVVFVSC